MNIGNVYGGGNKAASNVGTLNIGCTGTDGYIDAIYGGANAANITGNIALNITGGNIGNVFGGNNASGTINGGLNVIVDRNHDDEATDYGSYSGYGNLKITGDVYGGGNEAASAAGAVNIKCANAIANVFGGAKNADVTGDIVLTVGSGQIGNVYGGNNVGGTAGGNITVNVSKVSGGCGNNFTVGNVFGGGYGAGTKTGGNVTVNITDVAISGDVYGGSALGNVNTGTSNTTAVNLLGGSVVGNVYGGGLGDATTAALVKGKVTVTLGNDDGTSVIGGSIYGANNVNGTPKGTVNVIVNKTAPQVGAAADDYDVAAVYGGGNQAAYVPDASIVATAAATVTVNGCDNSIQYVYGGGNAAPVPATHVIIYGGDFEYVFGGGNGQGVGNPGANVGYMTYADNADEATKAAAAYGSGKAQTDIYGGVISYVYGGSNTKGNIRTTAVSMLDASDEDACTFRVGEIYGAGNEAPMDGTANLDLRCIPGLPVIFGGSRAADVNNDVVLTITGGNYGQVFGGNNEGGKINGSITVNIEETGCKPIVIGELYGCGNEAAYTTPTGKHDPVVNVVSFTKIGKVFGGGYGVSATVTGNPTVNINEVPGVHAAAQLGGADKIGIIGEVYGGGNAAAVVGNTFVNIGTARTVTLQSLADTDPNKTQDVSGVTIQPVPTFTLYEENYSGSGHVYGAGLGATATVSGNTKVVVGPEKTAEP